MTITQRELGGAARAQNGWVGRRVWLHARAATGAGVTSSRLHKPISGGSMNRPAGTERADAAYSVTAASQPSYSPPKRSAAVVSACRIRSTFSSVGTCSRSASTSHCSDGSSGDRPRAV